MFTVIRTLAIVLFFAIISVAAKAQTDHKVQFSIGPDAAVLTSAIRQSHQGMIGGSVYFGVPLTNKLYFTAATGYNYFRGKQNVDLQLQDAPVINYLGIKSAEVKAGFKYYLSSLFYAQGEGGGAFFSGGSQNLSEATLSLIYSVQAGLDLPLSNKNYLNIAIRYQSTFAKKNDAVKIAFLGLHAGFGF